MSEKPVATPKKDVTPAPPQQRASDPDEEWFQFFTTKQRDPEDVRKAVEGLFKRKRYGEVVSCLQGALASGQSQVWMYDVLAYSMKLDNRPEKEIERVMLSAVDLRGNDVPNLLLSAAYLVSIGGSAPALKLYRQASRLEPQRSEPYVLGLSLARDLKDYEALEWAAVGILTNAWTKDREKRHRTAEDAATDALRELEKAKRDTEAKRLKAAIAEAKRRDLIVRLEWTGEGDVDLRIDEPFKTTCSTEAPLSPGGGVLVHDGVGGKSKDTYDEYVCVLGGNGEYRARIALRDGSIVGKQCRLIITRHAGSAQESVEKLTVVLEKEDRVVTFKLSGGRREKIGPAPMAEEQASRRRPYREVIAQLMHRAQQAPAHVAYQFANGQFANGQFANGQGGFAAIPQGGGNFGGGGGGGGGGFGVGYRPVISVLNEGVVLTAAAVVSADRRYVKMALSPSFTALVEMATFTFSGAP